MELLYKRTLLVRQGHVTVLKVSECLLSCPHCLWFEFSFLLLLGVVVSIGNLHFSLSDKSAINVTKDTLVCLLSFSRVCESPILFATGRKREYNIRTFIRIEFQLNALNMIKVNNHFFRLSESFDEMHFSVVSQDIIRENPLTFSNLMTLWNLSSSPVL
jgi:hypothetical protein